VLHIGILNYTYSFLSKWCLQAINYSCPVSLENEYSKNTYACGRMSFFETCHLFLVPDFYFLWAVDAENKNIEDLGLF